MCDDYDVWLPVSFFDLKSQTHSASFPAAQRRYFERLDGPSRSQRSGSRWRRAAVPLWMSPRHQILKCFKRRSSRAALLNFSLLWNYFNVSVYNVWNTSSSSKLLLSQSRCQPVGANSLVRHIQWKRVRYFKWITLHYSVRIQSVRVTLESKGEIITCPDWIHINICFVRINLFFFLTDPVHWLSAKGVKISPKLRDSADNRLSVRVLQKSLKVVSAVHTEDCWGFLEPSRPEPGPGPGPVQTCPREKTLQSLSLGSERFIPQYLLPSLGDERFGLLCHLCSFPAKISPKLKSLRWSEV